MSPRRSAGFQNLKHARNVLTNGGSADAYAARPSRRVYLTVYWRDKESDSRGRETLGVWPGTLVERT